MSPCDGALAVDVDAVGRGQPDGWPVILRMCATMRAVVVLPFVPVIAAIGMRARRARREEHVDHRAGDVARLALGRRDVHAEAGRGVDLADRAADLAVRLA